MDRETLMAPIVASVRKGTVYSRGEIMRAMAAWTLFPVMVEGRHVGTLACKGTEVHVALVDGWRPRGSCRGLIRSMLEPLFGVHDFLTTKLRPGADDKQHEFVTRLGFRKTWADGDFQYYLLARMPFEKRKKS